MPKKRKVAGYHRNNKIDFPLKWAKMNQSFLLFEHVCFFYSALAILELQIYVVVEQFGGGKYLAAQRASRFFSVRNGISISAKNEQRPKHY